jgi:plastocyanin
MSRKEQRMRKIAFRLAVLLAILALGVPSGAGEITGTYKAANKRFRENAVVYVAKAEGSFPAPPKRPVMDQKNLTFIPHVLPVVVGTTVDFLNSDSVRHNVFSPDYPYNLGTWPQGQTKSQVFAKEGVFTQLCNVHPEMEAFVVVVQNPYFAVTDGEGAYTIKGVPAGKYTLKLWQEKLKKQLTKEVTVPESGKVTVDF